jgi:hypothetical protein
MFPHSCGLYLICKSANGETSVSQLQWESLRVAASHKERRFSRRTMKWGPNRFQTLLAYNRILRGSAHAYLGTAALSRDGEVQTSRKFMQLGQWGNHFINNSVTQKDPVGSFFQKLIDTKVYNKFPVRSEIL